MSFGSVAAFSGRIKIRVKLFFSLNQADWLPRGGRNQRFVTVEIGRRAIAAVEHFKLENVRLEGALDRANGDRARLVYELANSKRRANDSQAA
jgi:hypothetical protein